MFPCQGLLFENKLKFKSAEKTESSQRGEENDGVWAALRCDQFLTLSAIRQFLVCFQARGAPGEGQGDPGVRRRPEDLENPLKPIGNL